MKRALVAFVLFSVLAVPARLRADSVVANNLWYEFSFTTAGVAAQGCYPADQSPTALNCIPSLSDNSAFAPEPTWDFNVADSFGTLIVTDAFLYGDSFDVYDGGVLIFSTPQVADTGEGCGSDPVDCLADPDSSHASFVLGPGLQPITIIPNEIGDAGAAYFEMVNTPEPSELPALLLISGFALRIAARKRALRN